VTPDVDPVAAFERSRQRRRMVFRAIYLAVGGVLALGLVLVTWSCIDDLRPRPRPSVRASAAAVADAHAALEEALTLAREADADFRRAIGEAIAARPIGEGPCMYRLPARTAQSESASDMFMMRTIAVGDPVPGSRLLQRIEGAAQDIDEELAELHRSAADADQAARDWGAGLLDDTLEVVFVVERATEPTVAPFGRLTGGLEDGRTYDFIPGERVGRAYLWSFKFRGVVCAGDIAATSSPVLDFEAEAHESQEVATERVRLDLEIRTEREISAALRGLPQP
jgi:hypothetical protein